MHQRNMVRNRRPQIEIPNRQSGEFGTANAVSRGYRGASVPAASRAGDATGLVRCAGTMCARDGRLPACS
jgi:hypothetical protein